MKKLLLVLVVLALAPLANAGFMIVDAGGHNSITVAGPGTVTLFLVNTGTDLMMYDVELDADAGAVISGVAVVSGAGAGYAGISIPGITGKQAEVVDGYDNNTLFPVGKVLASFNVAYLANTMVSGYDYMSVSPNFGTLADSSVAGFSIIIPEPATIAVLSLGGLLLRRKK
ncbi:MAG: PEP-CTERM sorting domain-containing protein [Sedimentisphaerales bacterium]